MKDQDVSNAFCLERGQAYQTREGRIGKNSMASTNEALSQVEIEVRVKNQCWDVPNINAVRFEVVLPARAFDRVPSAAEKVLNEAAVA